MASYRKTAKGWRAELYVGGARESSTFTTKAQAQAWAAQRETELRGQRKSGVMAGKTLSDAFERYEAEVSVHKRGHRWEALRMASMARFLIGGKVLGDVQLADLTPEIVGAWRDARLKEVAGSTVNRDMNLLSHVLSTAQREWRWIAKSPTTDVRRPKTPPARDRRIKDDEIERLMLALGFDEGPVTTVSQAVAVAFLFAIETAMRAGEICSLTPADIQGRVAHLSQTKNGTARDVPLSTRALGLLALLPEPEPGAPCFGLTSARLDALFRKTRDRAMIENLTFHDTRHEAITRLAAKLNVLELARMVGHRDLKMLQIYYNASASDIAQRLD